MKVYMIRIVGKRRPVYHTEDPVDLTPRDAQGRPIRTRLERWWRNLRAALWYAVRRGGPHVRRVLAWLSRRPRPDEPLLQGMRRARTIQVVHPAAISERRARRLWTSYLSRRWRQSLMTLAGDLLLSPLIAVLMVVPGPNVIGYWFTYRIVTHLLAMRGIVWVRMGWTPVAFSADEALDRRIGLDDVARIALLSERLDLNDLDDFMRRLASYHRAQGMTFQAKPRRRRRRRKPVRPGSSPSGPKPRVDGGEPRSSDAS